MELQWPLILFTTFIAWSAGLFASQCAFALRGEAIKSQLPAWICSAVLLVIGGVSVFLHLQHWERIFNGFGHITSGITQELIAIVVLAVVAIAYLVILRKSEDKPPVWICVLGIVVCAALVLVMAHSYVMEARPAWNTPFWLLFVMGNACVLGPATMVVIASVYDKGSSLAKSGVLPVAGSLVNLVGTLAYTAAMAASTSSFANVGYHYDPSHPTEALVSISSLSPLAGDNLALVAVAIILGALAPCACTLIGWKKGKALIWNSAAIACALVGAICMRVVFYEMGASVFMFY